MSGNASCRLQFAQATPYNGCDSPPCELVEGKSVGCDVSCCNANIRANYFRHKSKFLRAREIMQPATALFERPVPSPAANVLAQIPQSPMIQPRSRHRARDLSYHPASLFCHPDTLLGCRRPAAQTRSQTTQPRNFTRTLGSQLPADSRRQKKHLSLHSSLPGNRQTEARAPTPRSGCFHAPEPTDDPPPLIMPTIPAHVARCRQRSASRLARARKLHHTSMPDVPSQPHAVLHLRLVNNNIMNAVPMPGPRLPRSARRPASCPSRGASKFCSAACRVCCCSSTWAWRWRFGAGAGLSAARAPPSHHGATRMGARGGRRSEGPMVEALDEMVTLVGSQASGWSSDAKKEQGGGTTG
ncbi:hypothetical protein B0H10DRAFT_2438515 [Mycena sp. CBHHK59/15]|nr:hypothetical protein B0H10DRAFT_2438515 [Mycena sp. CBHHK59/15]